jgi:hypothetical protein
VVKALLNVFRLLCDHLRLRFLTDLLELRRGRVFIVKEDGELCTQRFFEVRAPKHTFSGCFDHCWHDSVAPHEAVDIPRPKDRRFYFEHYKLTEQATSFAAQALRSES